MSTDKPGTALSGSVGQTGSGPLGRGRWARLASLPIPAFLVVIAALWAADVRAPHESLQLAFALNLVFSVVVSLFIAYLIGRTFVARGAPGTLLIGCGIVIWGLAGVASSAAGLAGAPPVVIHNTCVLLAAICHVSGALLLLTTRRAAPGAELWVAAGYTAAVGVVVLVTLAGLAGWLPTFFIPGQGGTPLRQGVLGSSIAMFLVTALLLRRVGRGSRSPFTYWYTQALGLIAVGLLGVMIQPARGSLIGWAGRAAQLLSGAYMLVAAIASVRETHVWGVPLEAALRRSSDLLGQAERIAGVGSWEWNVPSGELTWSDQTFRLFGLAPGQVAPDYTLFVERVHPEHRSLVRQAIDDALSGRRPYDLEYRIVSMSGETRWVHARSEVARDANGRAVRMIGTVLDITERKKAEAALRESEALRRAVTDNSPDAIYVKDRESRWILANPEVLRLVGKTAEQALGKTDLELYADPAIGRAILENDRRILENGKAEMFEEMADTPAGRRTFLSTKAPRRDAQGNITGIIGISRDITERKRAEEALRQMNETLERRVTERTEETQKQAVRLRALAAELTQVEQRERKRLATILHDHIQQLLVAARIQLEWLQRDSRPERFQATVQGVDSILKEALSASRSLTVELSPPVLHQAGLIGGLNWLASRSLEKNQFDVVLRSENTAEPPTEDLRLLLFECARELLLNAVKHSGVSQADVTLLRTDDGLIRLIVRDEGKGFDPGVLGNLPPNDGSFGLFSIQQRLAHVGGQMEIAAAPGKGTCITLTLPAGEAQPLAEAPLRDAHHDGEPGTFVVREKTAMCRVLVVDDHKIMREGLAGLMRFEPDIEVVGQAADGPAAIRLAAELQPDAIIMDINLGEEMDGVEATRQILAANPNIKVIGLSMHANNEVATALRDAGAMAYLTKGGPSQDLIASIRAARQPI